MACMGYYEIKPLEYKKFIEKIRCIHINNMLENELMC